MITIEIFNEKDVDYVLQWFANPNNRLYQKTKAIDKQGALELIRSSEKRKVYCIRLDNEPIGYAMLKNIPDNTQIGITIDEKFWGNGYGAEAIKLLENEARKLGVRKIGLLVHPENKRTLNLYKKLNYQDVKWVAIEKKL